MAEPRKRSAAKAPSADTAADTPKPAGPKPSGPGNDPAPSTPGAPGADPAKDPGPDTSPRPGPGADPKPDVRKHEAERGGPNVAQLKRAHESGAHRDKVAYPDPGASPLGTDDEAAGFPAEHERERVAMSQAAAPGGDHKPFEPIQTAPRTDPAEAPERRVETSGRFQMLVLGGAMVVIIAALVIRMALG